MNKPSAAIATCWLVSFFSLSSIATPTPAATIAAGASHTCAIGESTAELRCWGAGADGRLGNGSLFDRSAPVRAITPVSGWRSVASGEAHSCAIANSGAVYCWGANASGQLGIGTVAAQGIPMAVVGLSSGVTKLALGSAHSCALMQNGRVNCWGYGLYGQLGSGQTTNQTTPAEVLTLTDVVDLSAGNEHTCAALSDGAVKCWGRNHVGQVGDGSTVNRTTPVFSSVGLSAASLAVGNYHSCARSVSGQVRCWGYNADGELGNGTLTSSAVGVAVTGLATGVSQLAAGGYHTCAVATGGVLKCWGHNNTGQTGNGATAAAVTTPTDVINLTIPAGEITAGRYHSCVRASGNRIHCWGSSANGRSGLGNTATSPGHTTYPLAISGLPAPLTKLAIAGSSTCGVTRIGSASCWGNNDAGQLGDGIALPHANMVLQAGPRDVTTLLSGTKDIAPGAQHTCALKTDGTVWCWGANASGQLGDQTAIPRRSPVQVVGVVSAVEIVSGSNFSCTRTSTGSVWCWGANQNGQLGIGSTVNSLQAAQPQGLDQGIVDISAGAAHACAARLDGKVLCWGLNSVGQVGDGSLTQRTVPTLVNDNFGDYVAVDAGGEHSCGLTRGGQAKCWGRNHVGQLGDGTTTQRSTPAGVDTLGSGVVDLRTGSYHTCALRDSGALVCWGYNASNQLGDGTAVTRLQPVAASNVSGTIRQFALGHDGSCVTLDDGEGLCWGANPQGRLGNGSIASPFALPQPVAQWLQNDLIFRHDFELRP